MSAAIGQGHTETPAISVDGVTVHYGDTLALDRASLSLGHGRSAG